MATEERDPTNSVAKPLPKTASIVLAAGLLPELLVSSLSEKSEGARDAGGLTDPRASMRHRIGASGCGSAASPLSLQRPARGV